MDTQNARSGNKDNLAETWQQRSTTFSDGVIIFVIVIFIYLLGYAFNLFDLLDNWLQNVELIHFDELLLLLVLGFGIYSVRRWRELKAETIERKRAEETLWQSEVQLRSILASAPITIFAMDSQGVFTLSEGKGLERVGLQPGDNVGVSALELYGEMPFVENTGAVIQGQDIVRRTLAGETISVQNELNGIHFENHIGPLRNTDGKVVGIVGVAADITERKHAERALQQSEQKFRLLAENLPDIIARFDRQLQHIYINQQIETPTRMKPGGFLGKSNHELGMPLELVNSWDQALLEVFESGQIKTIEFLFPTPTGNITYYEARLVPEIAPDGSVDTILTISRDITEHKQAEAELKGQKERLQKIVDNIPVMIVFISPDGRTEWVNREWQRVLGWTLEEAQSREILVEMYPDPDERQEVLDFALHPPAHWRDFRIAVKDGQVLDTAWANVLLSDGSSIGIGQDITERKAMERELQVREQRFRQLFARAPISIWEEDFSAVGDWLADLRARGVHDLDAFLQAEPQALEQALGLVRLVDVNDTTLQLFEANSKEELLSFWTSLFTDDTFDVFAGELRVIWEGRNQVDFECSAQTIRGRPIHYALHWVAPLEDGRMDLRRVIVTISDITERKQAEQALQQSERKFRMLAEISHAFVEVGLDYPSVLNTVVRRTAELIGDSCIITRFSDDRQWQFPVAFYHPDAEARMLLEDSLLHVWHGSTDTETARALLSGEAIYVPVVTPEQYRAAPEVDVWPYLDAVGISSVLIVPLRIQDQVIGTLCLNRDRGGSPYTRDDQVLLQNVADRAALTIQSARLFEQVHDAQERLKVLSHRLLDVQETERRQIALELHDQIGQDLTAIKLNLQTVQRTTHVLLLTPMLEESLTTVESTLERVRNLSLNLRPSMLDDLGLVAALRWYVDRLARQAGLAITFTEALETRPDSTLETACFRVAQEALTNVIRHAQAQQVQVELWQQEADLNLLIRDDGRGFDVTAALEQAAHGASVGLLGMQERVNLAGGQLELESSSGYGTEVRVSFPLTDVGSDEQ